MSAPRTAGAALLLFAALAAPPARARVVDVPVKLDASFLAKLLEAQVFSDPGATLRIAGRDRCSGAVLSAPPVALGKGSATLEIEGRARGGLAAFGGCLRLFAFEGALAVRLEPYRAADTPVVRFRVLGSELRPRSWTLLPQERLWGWIQPAVHPRLEKLSVDLGPALEELRRLLPLFVRADEAGPAQRLADSLALGAVRAEPDAVVALVRFEVDDAAGTAPPETPLSPEELAAFRRAAARFDAFVTFVVKQAGRDAPAPALRRELLEVLLGARHDLVDALAEPEPRRGADPVREIFRRTWARLAPLLRQLDADLPAEGALRYLSFVAAGDALAALDAAAPAFGFELSSDGLRRLARTLAPALAGDPLSRSRAVDPELREIFGFGPPLPAPEPEGDAAPETTPEGVDAPGAGEAPSAPPPEPEAAPRSRVLEALGGALAALVATPAHAAPGPGEDLAALARRLNRWAPSPADFREYLPVAGRLLRGTAAEVSGEALAPPYRDLFPALLLATGWQESCWRQYVNRGGRLVTLRSPAGAVGIMQVSERVWRGFYETSGLRSDVGYNARAGGEILLHYLKDFAIAKREDRAGGALALARSSYAMYNGGPGHMRRWREPGTAPSLRAIDASFLEKYKALRAGDERALERCYTG
jgi:soluble lytic murein transglycosylase-like protein